MIVHLHPTGPWRIGPDSGDRDRVDRVFHSDTLYSAVSSAMARLGMIEEWLDATARAPEPAVRFSSCFPLQGETLFVVPPRSLWPPPPSTKVRWKGARFVPLSVVDDLIHARPVAEEGWMVDGASECLVPIGSQGSPQGPFRVSVRSNAAVDRHGAGVEPHSSACLEFAPDAGLWMTAAFAGGEASEKWKDPVKAALRLLVDSGLGGERSRGWGRASIDFSENEGLLKATTEASTETAWWMLSLFHPSAEDSVDWQRGNYSLTTRGGRVESDARWGEAKKPTRMVAEGSVIVAGTEPRGAATDVAPEDFPHPVYRAGFALAIPIPWRPSA
jgi:CRISPR type III-A-associated RAMP protein Csm4